MTDPSLDPARRLTDEEVSRVLKRASELQQANLSAGPAAGTALTDLMKAAGEAGLNPALIRYAADNLESSEPVKTDVFGVPDRVIVERAVDGEVSSETYEAMIADIHSVVGCDGTVATLGRSLLWRNRPESLSRAEARDVTVTVTPRRGRTTICIEERLGPLRHHSRIYDVAIVAVLIACAWMVDGISVSVATGVSIVTVLAGYSSIRSSLRRTVGRRAIERDALMDRLVARVGRGAPTELEGSRPVGHP